MARLQLQMQMGEQPDLARVKELSERMIAAQREWEGLIGRWKLSDDFQTREWLAMTRCSADETGVGLEEMGQLVRWQAECMQAFAMQATPPMPPAGVDMDRVAAILQEKGGTMGTMMTGSPVQVDAEPLDSTLFDSPIVRSEYEALIRDHEGLVRLGETYGGFDPLGKLAFLDQIDQIESRWDTFFARASLLRAVRPAFKEQCDEYMKCLGLRDADGFRALLGRAHNSMRIEAERERS